MPCHQYLTSTSNEVFTALEIKGQANPAKNRPLGVSFLGQSQISVLVRVSRYPKQKRFS